MKHPPAPWERQTRQEIKRQSKQKYRQICVSLAGSTICLLIGQNSKNFRGKSLSRSRSLRGNQLSPFLKVRGQAGSAIVCFWFASCRHPGPVQPLGYDCVVFVYPTVSGKAGPLRMLIPLQYRNSQLCRLRFSIVNSCVENVANRACNLAETALESGQWLKKPQYRSIWPRSAAKAAEPAERPGWKSSRRSSAGRSRGPQLRPDGRNQ